MVSVFATMRDGCVRTASIFDLPCDIYATAVSMLTYHHLLSESFTTLCEQAWKSSQAHTHGAIAPSSRTRPIAANGSWVKRLGASSRSETRAFSKFNKALQQYNRQSTDARRSPGVARSTPSIWTKLPFSSFIYLSSKRYSHVYIGTASTLVTVTAALQLVS